MLTESIITLSIILDPIGALRIALVYVLWKPIVIDNVLGFLEAHLFRNNSLSV